MEPNYQLTKQRVGREVHPPYQKTNTVMHPSGFPTYQASSAADWREYLAKHYDQLANTWLIIYKKGTGIPSLTYEEARDEALCFGWIDSKPNKRDTDSYYLFFAKRKPKSNWS
ncbi:MAG: hypothetical protein AAGA62_07530, partial [Bacteroidota bacterium]